MREGLAACWDHNPQHRGGPSDVKKLRHNAHERFLFGEGGIDSMNLFDSERVKGL
jgi:hypothetical protein